MSFFLLSGYTCFHFFAHPIVHALRPNNISFSANETLPIEGCQQWTTEVRSLSSNNDATEIHVLLYHQIIDQKELKPLHYKQENILHDSIILTEDFEKQMHYLAEEKYTVLTSTKLSYFINGQLKKVLSLHLVMALKITLQMLPLF